MTDLSSRRAFVALAAGAAVAAGSTTGSAAPASDAPSEAEVQAAREAARRLTPAPERRADAVTAEARILLCRSWDSMVYLYVSEKVKGFVSVSPQAFALAAACQAADRRVAVRYWGHEREWGGAGRFEGALFAVDVRDLPTESGSPA
jgi:hypothetical protein